MAYSSAVALTIKDISRAGLSLTKHLVTPTATHGNKFSNDGKTVLLVKNGSGAPITVTIYANRTVDGLTLPNLTATVAATGDADGLDFQVIGPFTSTFNQTDGFVWAVCSSVTSVSVGAYRLP